MITESWADYGGVRTRVLSVPGEGVPIVLLHGYADSADTWRNVLKRLEAAGRQAMALDLPGFGQAGARAPGPLLPQFDAFADAVLADVGPAVLVGNSLGAATSVRAAARNPDSVMALVALDDPLYARHFPARLARRREISTRVWSVLGRVRVPPSALQWASGHAMRRALYGWRSNADPVVIARWQQTVKGMGDVATLGRYALQYAYETRTGHRGMRVGCPTVIVHGKRDWIIPVHASRALHQQIPGSDFVVLPRSGHCPQLDDPDGVVSLVLRVLERAGDHREGTGT